MRPARHIMEYSQQYSNNRIILVNHLFDKKGTLVVKNDEIHINVKLSSNFNCENIVKYKNKWKCVAYQISIIKISHHKLMQSFLILSYISLQ